MRSPLFTHTLTPNLIIANHINPHRNHRRTHKVTSGRRGIGKVWMGGSRSVL